MAEIDGTNPLLPIWPKRPLKKIDEEDNKNKGERQDHENNKPQQDKKNQDSDDGSLHIDEYV